MILLLLIGSVLAEPYQTWKQCKEDFKKGAKSGIIQLSEVT